MPVDNLKFIDTVDDWVKATEGRMLAVFRESTQRLISLCQERIPVDTGFARASIQASLSSMPGVDPNNQRPLGATVHWNPGEVATVIAQAHLGDTIYVGWTAAYVIYLEYGHSSQAPSGFVRVSALEWPRIVSEVTDEAKATAGVNRGLG